MQKKQTQFSKDSVSHSTVAATLGALVWLLLLTLPAAVQAQTYTNNYGIWSYTTNGNGTCSIDWPGYTGSGGVVTIPSMINGLPVTSIGNSAFSDGDLTMSGLTIVTIPDSVTSIEAFAFSHCSSLIIVLIPNSVTNIGDFAFADCTSLVAIVVGTRNSVFSDVDGVLFNQSQTTLLQYPGGITGSYTIPNSVTSIGTAAFSYCTSLTSVVIGTNVTNIGNGAFVGCSSLSAITVDSKNPTYSSLTGVLFNKSQTTLIQYPLGKAGGYTIPDSVTSIGNDAFNYCTSLTSLTIPDSVTNIGDSAFGYCYGLTNATIGNGVTSIGGGAFHQCTSLTSVSIPNSVTSIGDFAFSSCTSLTSLSIPNNVTSIGGNAFGWCTGLTNITIGNCVTSIGGQAFNGCTSLASVTIGNSVTSIGDSAFISCLSLTSVYFRGNAPGVGSGVFAGIYPPTAYYLPGTTGWAHFSANTGLPTAAWFLPNPLILENNPRFGVKTNQFGFIISWATNISVVVEACTNLVHPTWLPLRTNTLSGGTAYFSDADWTNYPSRFYRVCGIAQANSAPPTGMALIPAGAFTMGDTLDGDLEAMPALSVTVSAFYMDTNLVSYSQWQSGYNWATSHGYGFVHAGAGKAANHPVQTVDWYDAVKWCNARSQQVGLTPVYCTDAGLTKVYTNLEVTVYVNWAANGYRLPTEAEWEKAARGGLSGQRFPWGNTLSESRANYYGCTSCDGYDLGPNGYNSIGIIGGSPYTSPVGYFAANGYGLYDMAGNVFQWCWDWYGTPYGQPTATNPTGPATGSYRLLRGGGWNGLAYNLRCAYRHLNYTPSLADSTCGFRCVRGS